MRNPYINLTGERFGRLIVTSESKPSDLPNGSRGRLWLCRCDCGGEKWVYSSMLRGGVGRSHTGTKSCGCLLRENGRAQLEKYGIRAPLKKEPGEAARRSVWIRYVRNARARDLDWSLSYEEFCRITSMVCDYCGAVPAQQQHGKATFNGACTYN